MDWSDPKTRASIKLDVLLELYKRGYYKPHSVAIDDLDTFCDSYDSNKCHDLINKMVNESSSVEYANHSRTRIQLTSMAKPQEYIDELTEESNWYN